MRVDEFDNAIEERIRHETVQVMLKRSGIRFKIDDREVDTWKRSLNDQGESFIMMDVRTGEQVCRSKN